METKQLQLVTYEQAKKLKELGFDWATREFYCGEVLCGSEDSVDAWNKRKIVDFISAPTVALALKWIRDEKGIFGNAYKSMYYKFCFTIYSEECMGCYECRFESHESHEAAESALLDELLIILEKEKAQ